VLQCDPTNPESRIPNPGSLIRVRTSSCIGVMATVERRHLPDRRQRDRRARIAALQTEYVELRRAVQQNIEQMKRLELEQRTQLIRIAQLQQEIDALKKSR
jgi:hypothetical protein